MPSNRISPFSLLLTILLIAWTLLLYRDWKLGGCSKTTIYSLVDSDNISAGQISDQSAQTEVENVNEDSSSECGYFVALNLFYYPRLGNQMFTYASFYGVVAAKKRAAEAAALSSAGKSVFVQRPRLAEISSWMDDAFENLSIPIRNYDDSWYTRKNFRLAVETEGHGKYYKDELLLSENPISSSTTWCDGRNVIMHGYRQSFKYFADVMDEIRSEFIFKPEVKRRAEGLIDRTLLGQLGAKRGDCVLVGAHMRRGDFTTERWLRAGMIPANEGYLNEAVTFFERFFLRREHSTPQSAKYTCLTFLLFGEDYEWNRKAAENTTARSPMRRASEGGRSNVIAVDTKDYGETNVSSSPAVDMCALSMCDHVIMTTGTFGWWAGFLSGGIVTYNAEYATPGTVIYNEMRPSEYFPPNWIAL